MRASGNHTSKKQHGNITNLDSNERFNTGAKQTRLNLCKHDSYTEPPGSKLMVQISQRSTTAQASTLPVCWLVVWQLLCQPNELSPKTDHSICLSIHFPNFSGLQHRSLLTNWLPPGLGASHPLVANVAEENRQLAIS